MKKILSALLAAVLLCALLTGCTPGVKPAPSPDPTPEPTPEPIKPSGAKASEAPILLKFRSHTLGTAFDFMGELDLNEIDMFKYQEDATMAEFSFEGIHTGADYFSVTVDIRMGTIGDVLDIWDLPEDTDHSGYLPALVDQMFLGGLTQLIPHGDIDLGSGYSLFRGCSLNEDDYPMEMVYSAEGSLESTALAIRVTAVCMTEDAKQRLTDLSKTVDEWVKGFKLDGKISKPEVSALPALKGKTLSGLPTDLVTAYSFYYDAMFEVYDISAYEESYSSYVAKIALCSEQDLEGEKEEMTEYLAGEGWDLSGVKEKVDGYYDWIFERSELEDFVFLAEGSGHGQNLLVSGRASGPEIKGEIAPSLWLKNLEIT